MDGGTGGYPDRREDEQPGIAPVDAGDATADQVAPAVEPTVQPTAPVEQPESAANAVTNAPANVTTATPTLSPAADTPEGFDMPVVTPLEPPTQGVSADVREMQQRQRATEERERALANAAGRDSASAAALKDAKDRAPSVVDQYIDHQLAPFFASAEALKGLSTGGGKGLAGVTTFFAVLQMKGERNALNRLDDIDKGEKPRPDEVGTYVWYYFMNKEKRSDLRRDLEQQAAIPLEQRFLRKHGNAVGEWLKIEPGDPRYKIFYKIGEEAGKMAAVMPVMYVNPLLGTVVMIASATGDQTNDAIENGATEDQAAEMNSRGVLRNTLTSVPPFKLAGQVGGGYMVRVIEGKIGPGWTKASGVGMDAADDAIAGGFARYWQNRDTREVYDPSQELDEDVLDSTLMAGLLKMGIGGAKTSGRAFLAGQRTQAQQSSRLHSNMHIEQETAKAEKAVELANKAWSLTDSHHLNKSAHLKRDIDELIDRELGPGQTGHIPPRKLLNMIEAGYFIDKRVDELGLREKIAKASAENTDVELSMKDLVKGTIRQHRMEEVFQNLKYEKDGPVAHEAGEFLKGEYGRLEKIEQRFDGLKGARLRAVEGGYAFGEIRKEVRASTNAKAEQVTRQAARRIEILEERARAMSTDGRRETADTVHLRDEFKSKLMPRLNLPPREVRRLEEEYVARRLLQLGIPSPQSDAKTNGAVAPANGQQGLSDR